MIRNVWPSQLNIEGGEKTYSVKRSRLTAWEKKLILVKVYKIKLQKGLKSRFF